MEAQFDLWRLAAGLGLFLFGMFQLEHALRQLAGRSFKKFLRRHTENPLKGVLSGALSTAALQSSSVVGLIVLALAGSGVISLASALGIVFGSNLGTTATGWIVATIGFKLDIESLALPLIAIGGLGVVWSTPASRRAGFSYLIAGFGLMLLGLEFMKTGALSAADLFDPGALSGYPLIVFLLVGLGLTAVIQSSSATIMITLSALHAGVIDLPSAAAVAIGADFGTTGTVLLGTLTGSAIKRQVAVGLLCFNIVADLIGFIFLHPLLAVIDGMLHIEDPLYALVAFHSLINLIGIVIFLPLTLPMSRLLQRRVRSGADRLVRYMQAKEEELPEVAIESLTQETRRLIDQACALNQVALGHLPERSFYDSVSDRRGVAVFEHGADFDHCYSELKRLEGEILAFTLRLQKARLDEGESSSLGELIPAIRNAVHSAKCIKDVRTDLQAFGQSATDSLNAYHRRYQEVAREFYTALETLKEGTTDTLMFELLVDLNRKNDVLHAATHSEIYQDMLAGRLSEEQVSTLLNVNREILLSNRNLLAAIAGACLPSEQADTFTSLPTAV